MESINAQTLAKESVKLERENLEELTSQIRGEIITPESKTYEDARSIYNAMIDKNPALTVKCNNVADVISCVNYTRERNLLTAVRCGGHNGAYL